MHAKEGLFMCHNIFKNTMVEMTWKEVERLAQENAVVLLPLGVIEEHGPHMPLCTDFYGATLMAEQISAVMRSQDIKTIIAPPFYWGIVSGGNAQFAGSFTSRKETVKFLLHDIVDSLKRAGFRTIIGIDGHGDIGHLKTIYEAFKESGELLNMNTYLQMLFDPGVLGLTGNDPHIIAIPPFQDSPDSVVADNIYIDIHAGATETKLMYINFPDLVDIELAKTLKPTNLTQEDLVKWGNPDSTDKSLTPEGYLGNPAGFEDVSFNKDVFISHLAHCIIAFLREKDCTL